MQTDSNQRDQAPEESLQLLLKKTQFCGLYEITFGTERRATEREIGGSICKGEEKEVVLSISKSALLPRSRLSTKERECGGSKGAHCLTQSQLLADTQESKKKGTEGDEN